MTAAHPMPMAPAPQPPDPAAVPARPWIRGALPYLVWEALLLLLVVGAAALVATRGVGLGNAGLQFNIAATGLLATGLALSLRTGTPNLAVSALAGLSGTGYAVLLDDGWSAMPAALAAVGVVGLCGLLLGLVTGLTSAPAWAVSLAALAGAGAIAIAITDGQSIVVRDLGAPTGGTASVWLLLFAVVTIGGGLLWQVRPIRDLLSANSSAGQPAGLSARRFVGAMVGFTGSSLLAALSGLVLVTSLRMAAPSGSDLFRLALVLAVVLLGGVSALGRRGGIAGTLLATVLLVLVSTALTVENTPPWITAGLLPAVVIIVGVLVGRLLDFLAGPEPARTPTAAGQSPTQTQ